MKAILAWTLLMGTIDSTPTFAQDDAQPVVSALTRCIGSFSGQIPPVSDPKTIPPGLIEGLNVKIDILAGFGGHAYSYLGTNKRQFTCGIAIYGPVAAPLEKKIEEIVAPYLGRGLSGVVLVTRQPSTSAPTLEVQYHKILLQ